MGFGVSGPGFSFEDCGFRIQCLGFMGSSSPAMTPRIRSIRLRVSEFGFEVKGVGVRGCILSPRDRSAPSDERWGSGFGVWGVGLRVQG